MSQRLARQAKKTPPVADELAIGLLDSCLQRLVAAERPRWREVHAARDPQFLDLTAAPGRVRLMPDGQISVRQIVQVGHHVDSSPSGASSSGNDAGEAR